MDDADLEEIRRARMAQLRQQGGSAGGSGGQSQGQGDAEQAQKEREAEARNSILSQILEPQAADRLGRIRLVKASRASAIENRLISMARTGQLRQKVTEEQLKELLSAVAENEEKSGAGGGVGKITVSRRKGGWDDDDEDLEDLLRD